jgi:hypothetical protein
MLLFGYIHVCVCVCVCVCKVGNLMVGVFTLKISYSNSVDLFLWFNYVFVG